MLNFIAFYVEFIWIVLQLFSTFANENIFANENKGLMPEIADFITKIQKNDTYRLCE